MDEPSRTVNTACLQSHSARRSIIAPTTPSSALFEGRGVEKGRGGGGGGVTVHPSRSVTRYRSPRKTGH